MRSQSQREVAPACCPTSPGSCAWLLFVGVGFLEVKLVEDIVLSYEGFDLLVGEEAGAFLCD